MLNKKAKQFLSFGKTVGSLMLVKYVGPVVMFILIGGLKDLYKGVRNVLNSPKGDSQRRRES